MLGIDDKHSTEISGSTTAEVTLPVDWSQYFDREGPLPTMEGDERRFARRYFRTRIQIRLVSTLPAFPRDQEPINTLGKDISRTGIALLSGVQLYPGERVELLVKENTLLFEVVRCRKVAKACFEVGAAVRIVD